MIQVRSPANVDQWRQTARHLLALEMPPERVLWEAGLIGDELKPLAAPTTHRVPAEFLDLCRWAACCRGTDQWPLLYRVLWRLTHGEPRLLDVEVDPDVERLTRMAQAVRRECHRMLALVRFRQVEDRLVAWYRPRHPVLRQAAGHFADRLGAARWVILTPDESAIWDGASLCFGPGVPHDPVSKDELEDFWRTYYASAFNPARLNIKALRRQLPQRYWPALPEAQVIPDLIRRRMP